MDRKDSYTEVFLKAAGVEVDVKKTKDFKAIWWYSTREKDTGGLRMTDHCLEFVETKSEIKRLSETVRQERMAVKFLSENKKASLIGITNKKNLIFKVNENQFRISPNGTII